MKQTFIILLLFNFTLIFCQLIGNPKDHLDSMYNCYVKELLEQNIEYNLDSEFEWEDGYIVTNDLDTVRGSIKKNKMTGELIKIHFQPLNSEEKNTYKAYDLISFRKGNFDYITMEVEEFKSFVRILESGMINLITLDYFSVKTMPTPYLTPAGFLSLPYGTNGKPLIYLQKGEKMGEIKPKSFKNISKIIFSDYAELLKKIDNDIYTFRDLRIIVKIYNERFK